MKRDMDVVRQILLAAEAHPEAYIQSFPVDVKASGMVLQEHLRMLMDAGFLEYEKMIAGGKFAYRITWEGHEFIDEIRDPEIWRKTKEGADKVGSWSIKLLGELASGFVRAKAIELGLPIA